MTKEFSTDEVVTQGDEYLRAKAGELETDTKTPPGETTGLAAGKAAKPAETPPGNGPGLVK